MTPWSKAVWNNAILLRSIAFSVVSSPSSLSTTRCNNFTGSSEMLINSKSNRNSYVGSHHDRSSFSYCISNSSKSILHLTASLSSRQYTTISRAINNRSLVNAIREPSHLADSSSMAIVRPSLLVSQRRSMASTMKKRRSKMNKHKLRKRRKLMKLNTKISRE